MLEIQEKDIQELMPYPDEEVPAALGRLVKSPVLERVRSAYFPSLNPEAFVKHVSAIRTSAEFQDKVIAPAIDAMLAASSKGFTISGFGKLETGAKFTFVSNHRDIICDPALFTYGLVRNGWQAPLICLGDNLLRTPWIVDLIKVNRGVTVKRGLAQRELLHWSQVLSKLINRSVRTGAESVWIAQREGRAKDGNDLTHPGVIKMLTIIKEESLIEHVRALRLVPIAISYEFDPCDALKARELHYAETAEGHQKRPGEDELSMALGIREQKGRIHLEIGSEMNETLEQAAVLPSRREQVDAIVAGIDRQIHRNYRLWPSNFIALDLLENSSQAQGKYTDEERKYFTDRMEKQLDSLSESREAREAIRKRLLEMYANPVRNAAKGQSPAGAPMVS